MLCRLLLIICLLSSLTKQDSLHYGPYPRYPINHGYQPTSVRIQHWLRPNQELIFSNSERAKNTETSTVPHVLINNVLVSPTMVPFIPKATTQTPKFLECLRRCPTTSEYKPVCASNRHLYYNEQKFLCARFCGAGKLFVKC